MQEIIINRDKENKKTITLVEEGKLVEYYEEINDYQRLEGNIYIGRVENIVEGMQAAFVNIGIERNAFVHIKDIIPKVSNLTGNKNEQICNHNIKDYLTIGMPVLIQIMKDATKLKGARASTSISIPGRFIVLLLDKEFVTISQKIQNEDERNRLINIVKKILPKGYGAIIRTSAQGKAEKIIEKDLQNLLQEYSNIKVKQKQIEEQVKINKKFIPELVLQNNDITKKLLRDLSDQKLNKVITNCEESYKSINQYLVSIDCNNKIEVEFKKEKNVLDIYDIESQIHKIKSRKIWLKCGGFITIDKTEALTAIDVNSGKYVGKNKSFEETILTVNLEASIEIAKQIRARDIGGIIIIDYIDMEKEETKNKILETLQEEMKKDRAKTQIVGFTPLDLLEITRKHMFSNEEKV